MDIKPNTINSLPGADTQSQGIPDVASDKIGQKEIREATNILRKYKEGKARLEAKIIANEEFWKLRQWNYIDQRAGEFNPATAWLWNCIQSRHSDVMDSFPTCNFRPRQEDDKAEAEKLSSIVPVVMEQNRYEETYSDLAWYMLKHGGCVQGVFWDGTKHNGLGDVAIKMVDFLNIFWEPGVKDIQESDNVFTVELVNNRLLEQRYPQTVGHLGGKKITVAKYLYDESIDTSGKSVVVDWYYHTEYGGKRVLQYCKFVNDVVLYATENIELAETGLYDHGLYPFVVQDLYPVEGSICGYGLTDIGRDAQIQIDILNKAVTDCAYVQAAPRYFYRDDGSVNEAQLRDVTQQLIMVEGSLDETHLRPMDYKPLSATVLNELQSKIDELKQVTSNQDANNGVAPSGITAASAIAALQETAGKNSRATNKAFYRAYRNVVYLVVELIRQFYDVPRTFRIAPDSADESFVQYSNAGIKGQPQMLSDQQLGLRVPEFDISVTAEKQSPYKKIEQNELALNFYQQGFFNPQMSDQALSCLEMMDFDGKEEVINRVKMNGTLQEMLLQFEQIAMMLAQKYEPQMADQIAQMVLQSNGQPVMPSGGAPINLDNGSGENSMVERARQQARESTQAE